VTDGQVAIVASIIFKLADTHPDIQPTEGEGGKNGVAWVLRFGGLMALVSRHSFPANQADILDRSCRLSKGTSYQN
jgi:hypothetical protein